MHIIVKPKAGLNLGLFAKTTRLSSNFDLAAGRIVVDSEDGDFHSELIELFEWADKHEESVYLSFDEENLKNLEEIDPGWTEITPEEMKTICHGYKHQGLSSWAQMFYLLYSAANQLKYCEDDH